MTARWWRRGRAGAHACRPGWRVDDRGAIYQADPHAVAGTIWECACGRSYVAFRTAPGSLWRVGWRPEAVLERLWRRYARERDRPSRS